jgi:outer membrane protein assembly factor BamB/predicted phosphodiesterase
MIALRNFTTKDRPQILIVLAILAFAGEAGAATVSGTVFADRNGDGLLSAGEEGVPGVAVWFETTTYVKTDAQGRYSLEVPRVGTLWASVPEGFRPGPVWATVNGGPATADLPLRPTTSTGPLRFVHVSDTHLGLTRTDDIRSAMRQALDLDPLPDFLVITGDIANGTIPDEYEAIAPVLAELTVPFVPVVGNHDWHDGGPQYRMRYGPPSYSFDVGGVHVLVLNFNALPADLLKFAADELGLAGDARPVLVFVHGPLDDEVNAALADLGVDYLFTGHTHSNRVMEHAGGLIEFNTQAFAMGGMDYTPAGYRVVTIGPSGPMIEHHTTVDRPVATLTWPRQGECIPPRTTLIAAVELGAGAPEVTLAVDGGPPRLMRAAGGWTYTLDVDLRPGPHELELRARAGGPSGTTQVDRVRTCVIGGRQWDGEPGEWPQLGGGPTHAGRAARPLAPPLHTAWAASAGGHVFASSVTVGDGRVFVPIIDYATSSAGGVVAFDLATGARLWTVTTGAPVHAAPIVDGPRVLLVDQDAVLRAVDAASGRELWRRALWDDKPGAIDRWRFLTCGTPTLADGTLYLAAHHRFYAIDPATGAIRWRDDAGGDDFAFTRSAPLVGGGVVMAALGRGRVGVIGWDAATGQRRWKLGPPASQALGGAPVLVGDHLALWLNVQSRVFAVDVRDGMTRWIARLYGKGDWQDWGWGPLATPAVADGRVYIPTPRQRVYALDLDGGERVWRFEDAANGLIRELPYLPRSQGFVAAPIAGRDVLWVPGNDGVLRAHDLDDGAVR